MDSYDYHSSPKVFDTIEWGLRQMWEGEISDFPDIKKEIVEVPQQPNPFDCSLFVMHMMSLFLHNAPERFQIDNLKMVVSPRSFSLSLIHTNLKHVTLHLFSCLGKIGLTREMRVHYGSVLSQLLKKSSIDPTLFLRRRSP